MNEVTELLFGKMPVNPDWLRSVKKLIYFENYNLCEAETTAEEIYKSQPESQNIFSRLAYYLMSEGLYDEADRLFKKDAEYGRQTWWGELRHAECMALCGNLEKANTRINDVYLRFAEAVNGYGHLSWTLLRKERINAAEALDILMKDSDSGRMTAGFKLIAAHICAKTDEALAEQFVRQAYEQDRKLTDGYSSIGEVFYREKEYKTSITYFEKDEVAERISPAFRRTYACVLLQAGDKERALEQIKTAYSLDPTLKNGYAFLGELEYKKNRYAEALEYYQYESNTGRLDGVHAVRFAELLTRSGKLEDAEKWIDYAYEQDKTLKDEYTKLIYFASAYKDAYRLYALHEKDVRCGRFSGKRFKDVSSDIFKRLKLRSELEDAEKRFCLPIGAQWEELDGKVRMMLLESCEADILGFRLKIASPKDALVQFREIILEENYYFSSKSPKPYIIDGGANSGMATAYFKWLYPESEIVAFEPNSELFDIFEENKKHCGWKNVTAYPYALSGKDGFTEFNIYPLMPMGSGITDRFISSSFAEGAYKARVQTVRLGTYLNKRTDFLKLDIEGAEYEVITDITNKLKKHVHSGFIEYHYDLKNSSNSMGKILCTLEESGFSIRITDSAALGNKTILNKAIYPEFWSMNILFTSSWTEFIDCPEVTENKTVILNEDTNMNGYLKNFFSLRKTNMEYPSLVQIETTVLCNSKCTFCPNAEIERKNRVMEDSTFEKIVSDLKDIPKSHQFIIQPFRTGEFLADKNIFKRIEAINQNLPHARIRLFSNFNMADGDTVKKLYDIANLDFLHISLHSFDSDEYKQKTGLDLNRTLEAVRLLLEANKNKKLCPHIKILRVEDGTEKDSEFLKYAQYIKQLSHGASNVELVLFKQMDWLGYLDKRGVQTTNLPCWRWFVLNIDSDGNVPLCSLDWNSRYIFGNVTKQHLLQIYNSPDYRVLREKISDRTKAEYCAECTYF